MRQARTELASVTAKQTAERHCPIQPSDLFGYAVGSQQIAHPTVCPDDTQYGASGDKFVMQQVQHAGATKIDIGRCGEIANHQADVGRIHRSHVLQNRFQDRVGVDVDQGQFGTESNHTRQSFIVGMTREV